MNIYKEFDPEHRKGIKDAVAFLQALTKRTGLLSAGPDLAIERMNSQQCSQGTASQDDGVFQKPTELASATEETNGEDQRTTIGKE